LAGAAIAVVVAQLAGATPGVNVLSAAVLARATLGQDMMLQVAPGQATGLKWGNRDWKASELPEFLKARRDQDKVGDLGAWMVAHPAVASKFGLPGARKIAAAEIMVQQITVAPGGVTGWHTHPGPGFVLVKSGELTVYDADSATCTGTTYKAGQSLVDTGFGHVHIGRNEGSSNLELYVVFLLPAPAGQPFRIDAPKPATCSF
jgi:quercetin dioxygenase-like cupin family protein